MPLITCSYIPALNPRTSSLSSQKTDAPAGENPVSILLQFIFVVLSNVADTPGASLSEPTSSVPVIDPKFTAEKLVQSHFCSCEGSPDFCGKLSDQFDVILQTWGQLGRPPSPLLDMSLFDIMSHDPEIFWHLKTNF